MVPTIAVKILLLMWKCIFATSESWRTANELRAGSGLWGCFGERVVFVNLLLWETVIILKQIKQITLNEKENNQLKDGITLEEGDIPGASFLKPDEQCNFAILKRWLLCRGAKISGKKNELINRYYIQLLQPFGILI